MLGLADRGRILDLFEKVMGGNVAEALADLSALYDRGADPLAVVQDLLETTHFLTRLKVAPNAEGFFDGGSAEARRAAELAAKLSVPTLTRVWQLLLKGLIEVRDATRPMQAAEMALIRLAYAADLPPTDKLVRELLEGESRPRTALSPTGGEGKGEGARPRASNPSTFSPKGEREAVALATASKTEPVQGPTLRTLDDIVALAEPRSQLRTQLEHNVRLIRLEPGAIEFSLVGNLPSSFAGDLSQKLRQWTGARWIVTVAREGGAPTLAEAKRTKHAAQLESVLQEPMVRAVLDRFPGAEVVAVHDVAAEPPPEPPQDESP
jgi:DNA polymerase-3 subunit gamma/tau